MKWLVGLFVFGISFRALAQSPVLDPANDLGGVVGFLTQAFQGGQYWALGAIVVMLAVWALAFFVKLDPRWSPVISAALGMLASLAVELSKDNVEPGTAIYKGLLTTGSAGLFWTMLGKKLLPKKDDEGNTVPPPGMFPKKENPNP